MNQAIAILSSGGIEVDRIHIMKRAAAYSDQAFNKLVEDKKKQSDLDLLIVKLHSDYMHRYYDGLSDWFRS